MKNLSLLVAWMLIWAAGLALTGALLKVMWIVFMAGWSVV